MCARRSRPRTFTTIDTIGSCPLRGRETILHGVREGTIWMRFLLGWTLKLSLVGVVYLGLTSGFKVKLPEEVMGYKMPAAAQQWVDRNGQIGEYVNQAK